MDVNGDHEALVISMVVFQMNGINENSSDQTIIMTKGKHGLFFFELI